jgi:hypothetical protein
MLTKEERELLRDTKDRLKRHWAGVGDYSTVEGLVQIIERLAMMYGRAFVNLNLNETRE